jgi:hypothetical protein
MATHRVTPPWHYLHEASDTSLESFELSRLNHAANLRKEIAALLEQWIEVTAEAFLARWVREDRKLPSPPDQEADILPQAELPFAPPRIINDGPRQPIRRLRSRIRTGDRTSA